jgi:hypothetical protein
MRTRAFLALLAAAALAGCAAPEFTTFYLSAHDWRGTELSGHGRLTVADAVAGTAPGAVTILEIGGLLEAPRDPERRLRLQEARARALTAALERHGVSPATIGVELAPADGAEREPPPPLVAKPMVVVVHY